MSAFEDFVNLELPRRSAFLTVAIAGFDGDPNSGGAPALLQGAPTGTWYLRETPVRVFYRKVNSGATDWIEALSESEAGVSLVTTGDMSIPVDYNDGSAVDPTPGLIFANQDDVDDFLAVQGASNFKHIAAVYEAFPRFIAHDIDFTLASGVHRPRSADTTVAFSLTTSIILGDGSITFNGEPSSGYNSLFAPESILGVQTGSDDPYVDVAASTYPNDGSLKGKFAVFSTGQVAVIHDHTDSRLFLLDALSPDPTGGTVEVATPSTIIRNSLDDSTRHASQTIMSLNVGKFDSFFVTRFNDVLFDPFGASSNTVIISETGSFWNRVIYDQEDTSLGQAPSGNSIRVDKRAEVAFFGFSHLASTSTGNVVGPLAATEGAQVLGFTAYLKGGKGAVAAFDPFTLLSIQRAVFDNVGRDAGQLASLVISSYANFSCQHTSSGKVSEIRDAQNAGLAFELGGYLTPNASSNGMAFKACTDACIRFLDRASFIHTLSDDLGFIDGGGNADVGIDAVGPYVNAVFASNTSVSGSVGDLRIDGIVASYTDLENASPLATESLNRLEKLA